ncbi:MAG: ATP-dependent Clp protease proteolytic subunit, partial [Bacteroidota bacterium]
MVGGTGPEKKRIHRIVKAIEASDAPVHVVVKSFAASMAAVITTLADHSYAYPNAIVLHHQMSAGVFGNMTDMEQRLEMLKEWEARLAVPVAEKMGITLEEFKAQMYENMASGDWVEFADKAVELKWVNQIVGEVR